jgi:hypothetical protein
VTKLDVLGIVVFTSLVLGMVALRLWGTAVLREVDGLFLVTCASAGWLGLASFLVEGDLGARGSR